MRILAMALSLMLIGGCALFQKQVCNSGRAIVAGRADAQDWSEENKGLRSPTVCESGDYPVALYQKDYFSAYNDAMMAQCDVTVISAMAAQDAQVGKTDRLASGQLNLCSRVGKDPSRVSASYDWEFQRQYCTEARVTGWARTAAASLARADHSWENTCTKNRNYLRAAFSRAYLDGLQASCEISNVSTLAMKDADAAIPMTIGMSKLAVCPTDLQYDAVNEYQKAFTSRARTPHKVSLGMRTAHDSQVNFSVNGQNLTSTCQVLPNGNAEVVIANNGNQSVIIPSQWDVDIYDPNGRVIRRNNPVWQAYVESQKTARMEIPSDTAGAATCKAAIR